MSEMDSSGSVTAGPLGGIPATTDVYTAEQVNAIVSGVNDNINVALCGFTPSGVNDLLVEFYGLIDVVGSGAGIGRTIGSMIVETQSGLQSLSGEVNDNVICGTSGLLNLYSVVEGTRDLYDTVIDNLFRLWKGCRNTFQHRLIVNARLHVDPGKIEIHDNPGRQLFCMESV